MAKDQMIGRAPRQVARVGGRVQGWFLCCETLGVHLCLSGPVHMTGSKYNLLSFRTAGKHPLTQ